jgi:hypothetical protein
MKKIITLLLITSTVSVSTEAQGLKGLINKAKDAVSGKTGSPL